MSQDPDRFRPRSPEADRSRSTREQSPPEPSAPSAVDPRDGAARQQPGAPTPTMGPPQTRTMEQADGVGPYRAYIPPNVAQRYSTRVSGAGDAQLIHPAAAQLTRYTQYGVPVYRAPVYSYGATPQRGLSITAMVLGLCSAVFAWTLVVVPIIGLVFGFIALRRETAGRGMAITGLITSALGLVWVLLFYLVPLLGLLMLFAGVATSP